MASAGTEAGLRHRVVGLPTAVSATFGLILATTVMVTVPQGFSASGVFLLAILIGLLTMYLQGMSFSELATMIPKAGSMNEYVRAGLGPFFATLTVLVGYVAIVIFPTAAESFLPSAILTLFLGADWFGDDSIKVWVVIIVAGLGVLNLLGVRAFAALEVPLTFLVAGSLFLIGLIGLTGIPGHPVGGALPGGVPFSWDLLFTLLGLAVFTFVGVEYTCPLAEELRQPERDIPWGIFIGLGLVGVTMILYGMAATRYLPLDQLGDPEQITNMNVAIAIFGEGLGKWWMGILSVMATLATVNAVIAGVSRILYGMALTNQLPRFFAYLIPSTRAPAVGIVLVALGPILMNVFSDDPIGTFLEFILAGVLGWGTAYVLIHISLIALRVREPAANRPYRSPLFPVPQVLGIVLLALAAWKIAPPGLSASAIYGRYGIFLLVAIVFSFVYNAAASGNATAQFRPVPLDEVYRETQVIAEELPVDADSGSHERHAPPHEPTPPASG